MKEGEEGESQEGQPRRSERKKKMTEKGAEFTFETKLNNREKCYKVLLALGDNLKGLLESSDDKDTIKTAYSKWLDNYEDFLEFQEEVKAFISPSEQMVDEEIFAGRNKQLMDVKKSVEKWFSRHSKGVPSDKRSIVSKSSNYSVAKLEEKQHKAELLAKAAALKEKKQIEEAKLQLKMKEEELNITNGNGNLNAHHHHSKGSPYFSS